MRDKVLAIHILFIMVMMVLIFFMTLTVSLVSILADSRPVDNKTYIIVIKQPTKEVIKEVPKTEVKETSVKPKVATKQVNKKPTVKPKTNPNAYLLAQIIHAEANTEPYTGKVAVGNVIMNRVKSDDFPDTIKGVIFQKGQFQPVSNGSIYNKPSSEALKAANEVLNGRQVVSNQALYFYNPAISTSDWIFSRKTITTIGNHRFAY